jgi:hypothetical protein
MRDQWSRLYILITTLRCMIISINDSLPGRHGPALHKAYSLRFADFGHYFVGDVEVGGDVLDVVVVVEAFQEF